MISLNSPDLEGISPDAHKTLAKATILMSGMEPTHAQLVKRNRLPEGVPGYNEGHTLLGYFALPPHEGMRFLLMRYNTAGREAFGKYDTSPVTTVTQTKMGWEFTTVNSVYELTITADPLEGM